MYLNGGDYRIEQGDLVLVHSDDVHYFITDHEDTEHIGLQFDPEILEIRNTGIEFLYTLPFTSNFHRPQQQIFRQNELSASNIPTVLNDLLHEYQHKRYGFELAMLGHIHYIALWILRYRHSTGGPYDVSLDISRINAEKLRPVLDYVEKHYVDNIPVEKAASLCNMSYNYFSSQFNKIMGQSFTDYVNRTRVREAEKLLLTSSMNITEMALAIGYTNTSYFIRQFKKYKNITPMQFIKKYAE
jgi:AraC-like DNA-binding protein